MAQERLQKIVARAGLASRRGAEELITSGRVRVNGRVVIELGAKADARVDRVEVDGVRLVSEDFVYLVLHKPRGVVSTRSDPEGRPTVTELVTRVEAHVYPVGRLDFHTSGALLLTNDGEFTQALLHPRKGVPKIYVVKVQGVMNEPDLERWRGGVQLEDGMTAPCEVSRLRYEGDKTWIEVTLHEGRNQQIRRMGEATGFRVMRLARLSFAGITTEGLRPGEFRALTVDELRDLKQAYGVPKRVHAPAALPAPAPNPERSSRPRRAARPGGFGKKHQAAEPSAREGGPARPEPSRRGKNSSAAVPSARAQADGEGTRSRPPARARRPR